MLMMKYLVRIGRMTHAPLRLAPFVLSQLFGLNRHRLSIAKNRRRRVSTIKVPVAIF